jgi:hypothetical protein
LKALLKSLTDDAKTRKRNLGLGLYALTNDPKNPVQPLAAVGHQNHVSD